jgi:hypothetical protein
MELEARIDAKLARIEELSARRDVQQQRGLSEIQGRPAESQRPQAQIPSQSNSLGEVAPNPPELGQPFNPVRDSEYSQPSSQSPADETAQRLPPVYQR